MARPSLKTVISYGGEEHFNRNSLNWTDPNTPIDLDSSVKLRSPFTPGISWTALRPQSVMVRRGLPSKYSNVPSEHTGHVAIDSDPTSIRLKRWDQTS